MLDAANHSDLAILMAEFATMFFPAKLNFPDISYPNKQMLIIRPVHLHTYSIVYTVFFLFCIICYSAYSIVFLFHCSCGNVLVTAESTCGTNKGLFYLKWETNTTVFYLGHTARR